MFFLTIGLWIVPLVLQNNLGHEFSSPVWWGPESLVVAISIIVYLVR